MSEHTNERTGDLTLLNLYRGKVRQYVKRNGTTINITIDLTEDFLKTCEERIVEGHKKYGDDWKTKDNLRELEFEKYDIVNYLMLHECQLTFKALTSC